MVSASSSRTRSASATRSVSGTEARERSQPSSRASRRIRSNPAGGVPARRARVVERVDEPRLLGLLARQRADRELGRRQRAVPGRQRRHQLARPLPQRREVGHPEPPAGPGEQADGGRPRQRVGDQPQGAGEVAHLRGVEQPAQPDDLHRQPAGAQRGGDRVHVGPATDEHRRGGRRAARLGRVRATARPPRRRPRRPRPRRRAAARPGRRRPGRRGRPAAPRRPTAPGAAAQRPGHGVGQREHLRRVAEARQQPVLVGRRAARRREVGRGTGRGSPALAPRQP